MNTTLGTALGAAGYTCNATICYGSQAAGTDQSFKALQAVINRFAGVAGFSPVTVDGFIGDGTVAALRKTLAYLTRNSATAGMAQPLVALAASKESVAADSPTLVSVLTYIAASAGGSGSTLPAPPVAVPSPPPPIYSVPTGPTAPPAPMPMPPSPLPTMPGTAPGAAAKVSLLQNPPTWAYYVAGGLVGIGVLFWLHAFAKRSRKKSAASAPASAPVSGSRKRRKRKR